MERNYKLIVNIVKKKMQTSTKKNVLESLQNLAHLIGIELKRGWRTRLADWLGVKLRLTSNWISRYNIPEKEIIKIEKRGFPREKWLIPLDWINIKLSEKSVSHAKWNAINNRINQIIEGLGITRYILYDRTNINPKDATDGYPLGEDQSRYNVPLMVYKIAEFFGYRKDWIWDGIGNPRSDNIHTQQGLNLPTGSWIGDKAIPSIQEPETAYVAHSNLAFSLPEYINKVIDIFASDDDITINILKYNIDQSYKTMQGYKRTNNRLHTLERECDNIRGEINALKNTIDGSLERSLPKAEGE
jgi:hypothetical protein